MTNCACRHHTSWCSGILTEKGWSSDFPPLPSAFSNNSSMAFMLRSHNGVHCCGTVGDSHPSSQLSTAKCTFTGDSFQNHDAKLLLFHESSHVFLIFFSEYAANLINFSKYDCYDNDNSAIITIFAQKIARRYSRSAK